MRRSSRTDDDGWSRRGRRARAHAHARNALARARPRRHLMAKVRLFVLGRAHVRDGLGQCDGGGSVRESSVEKNRRRATPQSTHRRGVARV